MKVLVADDSEAVRNLLRHLLEAQGYEVVLKEDGQRAWDALLTGGFRLAIVDWMMPEIDGVDICKRLRDERRDLFVYVILLTSKSGDENIVEALQAGASDYLTKPFRPPELFARLRVGERIVGLQLQLAQREKLEAIGRLASGVAHEINTPTQFVGDNVRFLRDAVKDLARLLPLYERALASCQPEALPPGLLDEVRAVEQEIELAYVLEEAPKAAQQALEGVERVAKIVRAMKELSHPGWDDRQELIDLNQAIENALAVSRSEWKTVSEVVTELDPALPAVPGFPGALNQVLLNLIINAAQAIEETQNGASSGKGTITVRTRAHGEEIEVRIQDTGGGIAEEIRPKIFEPFFTTKPLGKGTGQGLAIAHSVVVDKHGGALTFESEVGKGTTFIIRLPAPARARSA